MFEMEAVRPYLVRKLKWVSMDPLAPPVATPLLKELFCNFPLADL